MSQRRRFNGREHIALYLTADGYCTECGTELTPGWHADHVIPWSRTGPTDLDNGQALCPACNLKKGNRMELRDWQNDALGRFLGRDGDFLCVATPGAGKTTFALTAAARMIEREEINRVIVVVPTSHLRQQWATAAAKVGIQLDYKFANGNTVLAPDYHGAVVCYATVATQPYLWHNLTSRRHRSLVILDEVHHIGDDAALAWGPAMRDAFDAAGRRLMLSGTPFRSDGKPIPWVEYDRNGRCVPSFNYDYGTALADRGVVRPVAFPAMDGTMRWRDAGTITTGDLATLIDARQLSRALATAFDPAGQWISSVIGRADEELTRLREETPDAGGLIVATDQPHARAYAALLTRLTGEVPIVAISDEPEASARIEAFARGRSRWIVAVQMVSEGVDIPRLAVGVYASRIATEMFFRQVVGRFVRMRGTEDETSAMLFIPSIEPLLSFAADIERTVEAVLAEEEHQARQDAEDESRKKRLPSGGIEPLDSSEAVHHVTIASGEKFGEEELRRAEAAGRIANVPASMSVNQIAMLLRIGAASHAEAPVRTEPQAVSSPAGTPARTLTEQKAALRKLIGRKVGQLQRATGTEFAHIHGDLNKECGDKATTATVPTLAKRLALLDRWLNEAL